MNNKYSRPIKFRFSVLSNLAKQSSLGLAATLFFLFWLSPGNLFAQGAALKESQKYLDITVKETAGISLQRSLTGGVPIAEGAAPEGSKFVLLDGNNQPVPSQAEVLARWNDGSARWVLLDFQADPQIDQTDRFRLVWDQSGRNARPAAPVKSTKGKQASLSSGAVSLKTVPGSLLRIADRFDVKLVLTDQLGRRCEAVVASSEFETQGNMRSTLALSGSFETPEGQRLVDFRLRASVFSGLPRFYLEPQLLVNADTGIITRIQDLSLEIVALNPVRTAGIGGNPGWKGTAPDEPVRLFQIDDEQYRLEGAAGSGTKAPGWMEIDDGKGTLAVTLRDFWEQWPKSLEVGSEGAKLGLFPYFEEGEFAHMEPWYKHDYLFENNYYRLREGQARRWQVWFDLSGAGEKLAKAVDRHLVPAADPVQAIATGEWGFIAASGTEGMAEYDTWAENQFEGYVQSIREQRDYGAMNWGDWWGERGVNWGNHEYDTPLHILTQFARTGDPKYFYVGEQSARHMSEVDVVHSVNPDLKKYFSRWEPKNYPSRPGIVHEHTIGHVGGFHPIEDIRAVYEELRGDPNPYIPMGPFNLGHIWTLGMAHYYLLTGDPWVKETIGRIGDNLMKLAESRVYPFKGWDHVGRTNGWSMLALAGEYKINPTERCLNAMRHIADEALEEQNPNSGGWMYSLPWGHCNCVTREERKQGAISHVGEAGFITSVRLNGLSYYYRLTGDERIPNVLLRGITHLNNDTWHDHEGGWRYTSCPATARSTGQTGVTMMALVNSVGINGDHEHLRILRKAWEIKFKRLLEAPSTGRGLGKSYTQNMYGSPEAANLYINGVKKEAFNPK